MSRRLFLAVFAHEEHVVAATRALRERHVPIVDVYTPYAVHGLDEAMGLKPSRLSRVCLLCGVIGAALAMWFQYWTMTIDWPINVGGRPWNSWPAFLPVTFETMVLLAGFGVVFAFFLVSRLYPGKSAQTPLTEVTTDRFVLVLEEGAAFDAAALRELLRAYHVTGTEEREEQPPAAPPQGRSLRRWNWALGIGLAVTVFLNWFLSTDPTRPNRDLLPDMVYAVPYESFSDHPLLPGKSTLQTPQPGSLPRGHMPWRFGPSPEEAMRASKVDNPLKKEADRWRGRGAMLYGNYCKVCHGPGGDGDGPAATRASLGKWSLVDPKIRDLSDGQLFHVLTYGKNNMASYAAQLPPDDRWAVILFVRSLQRKGEKP